MRMELFQATDDFVNEANSRNTLYTAGHNKFSDWTVKEKNNMLGLLDMPMPPVDLEALAADDEEENSNIPTSWDWRSLGKTTAVKDQG